MSELSQEARHRYGVLYERLRDAAEQRLASLELAPTSATRASHSYAKIVEASKLLRQDNSPLRAVLSAEQRAWVAAFGSTRLEHTIAAVGPASMGAVSPGAVSFERAWRDAMNAPRPLSKHELRNLGLSERETRLLHLLDREWIARAGSEHLSAASANAPARHNGAIYEQRVPGRAIAGTFVVLERPNARGLTAVSIHDLPGLAWLASNLRGHPRAFLGAHMGPDGDGSGRFLVADHAGGQRVEAVRFDFDSDIRSDQLEQLKHLNVVATPQHIAGIYEQRILAPKLEVEYGLPMKPIPDNGVVRGRVDRLVETAQGAQRALIVVDDALHLVWIGSGEQAQQQAKQLLGRSVELSRSTDGLRLSFSRGQAREEGLGR